MENHGPPILVTGAAGLLGRAVLRELAPVHRILGVDLVEPERAIEGVEWEQCDLTSDASTERAFRRIAEKHGHELGCVIHLASYYDFSGDDDPLYHDLTVEGTRRLLAELQNFSVQQFVFSSSLLVMAPVPEGERLTEEHPVAPGWSYPRSKLEAEQVIERERGGIKTVVLRLAGAYDEGCHSISLARQMRRIYERKRQSFLFPGNPLQGQAFLHRADVARCMACTIQAREQLEPIELFLVGEPRTLSYAEIQRDLGKAIHGQEWPTIQLPWLVVRSGRWIQDRRAGREAILKPWVVDVAYANRPVSIARARSRLNFAPMHELSQCIPEMGARLRADPAHWYRENGFQLQAGAGMLRTIERD